MILGKIYDESLWLMLKSDKRNRGAIAKFIKTMPEQLYKQINEKMEIVQYYIKNNISYMDRDERVLHGNVVGKDGLLYFYMIDPYCNSLHLGCAVKTGDCSYDDVFEITLYSNDSLKSVDEILGTVEYYASDIDSDLGSPFNKKVEYHLTNLPFALALVVSYDNSLKLCESHVVNLRTISDEIRVSDIKKNGKIKRGLVRTRRLDGLGGKNGI